MYQSKREEDRAIAENRFDLNQVPDQGRLKYEIAMELGLYDKVLDTGWKSLTAKESGRIGGLMNRNRKKELGT